MLFFIENKKNVFGIRIRFDYLIQMRSSEMPGLGYKSSPFPGLFFLGNSFRYPRFFVQKLASVNSFLPKNANPIDKNLFPPKNLGRNNFAFRKGQTKN